MNGTIEVVRLVLAVALHLLAVVIGGWDIYFGYRFGPQATVSGIVQGWAREFPILPVVVGILIGHVFWPTQVAR